MAAKHRAVSQPQSQNEPTGCLPALARAVWMMVGNLALLMTVAFVAQGKWPVVADIALFATAVGLVMVRYVDITRLKGQTADGKPATMADWRRYAATVTALAVGLWALARLAASRGLM